jgi:glutathione S-transferase
LYRLISATPSPYARKVRIALLEKSIAFELQTEVPWHADTATPAYNPLEKLPVLITADGTGIYESRFILEWLEVMHPEPRLLPRDPVAALAARQVEVICPTMELKVISGTAHTGIMGTGAVFSREEVGRFSKVAPGTPMGRFAEAACGATASK